MAKREDKPAEGSGPPEQDELPPTAAELDARLRMAEDALVRLGAADELEAPPDEAPPAPPAPGPARDLLDRTLRGE